MKTSLTVLTLPGLMETGLMKTRLTVLTLPGLMETRLTSLDWFH